MEREQRNQWIIDNMKFVFAVCKKWRKRDDYEDILQTAFKAAIIALDRADEDADGKAIRSYVAKYINGIVGRECFNSILYIPHRDREDYTLSVLSIDKEIVTDNSTNPIDAESLWLRTEEHGYDDAIERETYLTTTRHLTDTIRRRGLMLIAGYSQSDVARIEGCAPQAIGCSLNRIKKEYKRMVG